MPYLKKIIQSRVLYLLVLLWLWILIGCDWETNIDSQPTQALVIAKSGLVLRKQPSIHSPKLGVIPYDSKIAILKRDKLETISDRTGYWVMTQYQGQSAWVFGGFLIKLEDFDPIRIAFSQGTFSCDPITYSEYEILIEFQHENKITLTSTSAYNLGDPDCAGTDYTILSGNYKKVAPGLFSAEFTTEKSRLEVEGPKCKRHQPVKKKIDRKAFYYSGSCINKEGQRLKLLYERDAQKEWVIHNVSNSLDITAP